MAKFRKKPVVIEAMQFTSNAAGIEILDWADFKVALTGKAGQDGGIEPVIEIETLEGTMNAYLGDWIIKEPFATNDRQFYPCKPDIFAATYEAVAASTTED